MSKLIILRGNSGSGKTSAGIALQKKFGPNTMLISHDMIRLQVLHVWSREGVEKSLPLMIELLKYGRRHSTVSILEGILPAKDYAPLFHTAVEEYGPNIFAYYYDLPFEETLRRHAMRPQRFQFGEADMRSWWRERDLIGSIPEAILTAELTARGAARRIYRDITGEGVDV